VLAVLSLLPPLLSSLSMSSRIEFKNKNPDKLNVHLNEIARKATNHHIESHRVAQQFKSISSGSNK